MNKTVQKQWFMNNIRELASLLSFVFSSAFHFLSWLRLADRSSTRLGWLLWLYFQKWASLPSVNDHATMIAVNHTLIVMTSYSYGASIGAYALTYTHAIPKEINYMLAFFFYGTIHKIISMMYGPVTWEYITLIVYTQ